jgi:hypothetical protein
LGANFVSRSRIETAARWRKKKADDAIGNLLARGEDAKAAKRYKDAFAFFDRAITLYPQEQHRLRELVATTHLQVAEDEASAGRLTEALNVLLEAYSPDLPGRLGDRYRQRYADYYTKLVTQNVGRQAKQNKWRSIGVVAFFGEDPFEGEAVAARIAVASAKMGGVSVSVRTLSPLAVSAIIKGQRDAVPEADRVRLSEYKDDATIVGRLDKEVTSYVYDADSRKTQVLQSTRNLGPISGIPRAAIWEQLLTKRKSNSDFRVDVWTERAGYRIGDELTVFVRANRDCYLTVLDLQTSGNLYVLLPNQYQAEARAKADTTYAVPSSDAPFTIAVNGPAGVEGIKVIATRKPLSLTLPERGKVFATLTTRESQDRFARSLVSQIEKLNNEEWDSSEWTVRIGN